MRKTIYIVLIFGILISCKQKIEPIQVENEQVNISDWKIHLDTILERNNPKNLDLSKHQLFIDTTRNSEFFQHYLKWKPIGEKHPGISEYLDDFSQKYESVEIEIEKFPKHWFSLKRKNNEFVIYQPCDGNTISFEITKSAVIFYYQIESSVESISKVLMVRDNEIELELNTFAQKSKSKKSSFKIKPTEFKNVYKLTHSYDNEVWVYYITPKENVSEFDLIVNHCPTSKVSEYDKFDE